MVVRLKILDIDKMNWALYLASKIKIMHAPPFLKAGSKVAIVSPARKVSREEIEPALTFIQKNQWELVITEDLFGVHHQWSGTDKQRADHLQGYLDNPEIDLIWCARGGYGSMRILEFINWEIFRKHPKWLLGFSDITALTQLIVNGLGSAAIHGPLALTIGKNEEAAMHLYSLLSGKSLTYKIAPHSLNRNGSTKGRLQGGNLSLLYALQGSDADIIPDGAILFIEDLDEYLYHIDRMMLSLRRSGKLAKLSGLIVGGFTEMKDHEIPFGYAAEEIILHAVRDYDFPVCFDFPAGHVSKNLPIIMGAAARLEVGPLGGSLTYLDGQA